MMEVMIESGGFARIENEERFGIYSNMRVQRAVRVYKSKLDISNKPPSL